MNIIFIAPPAAGKGTQSAKVCSRYGIPHISTGDLLRGCEDESIQKLIRNGEFVSDEIVVDLLKKRIKEKDCDKGFVLDGFPRNIRQAEIYEDMLQNLGKGEGVVIILDIDKEVAEKRITGRLTCPNCGEVFNEFLEDAFPQRKGLCDYCHHSIVKREDDNKKTFENRYNIYEKETLPLVVYYENKGLAYHVNSGVNVNYTLKQVENIIDNMTRR